jgi:uncharacterized protein YidB (DUF937 family)
MASSRMTALLALLAVAGYQNRDKLGEILGNITGQKPGSPGASPTGGGGLGGLLGGLLGGAGAGGGLAGGGLAGGLGDLIENITKSGHGEAAKSWVETGPNKDMDTAELEEALGSDTIGQLAAQTGLSRDELLSRLKSVLPTAVDRLTPAGRLPTESEAAEWRQG